jgi:hypothetical protein
MQQRYFTIKHAQGSRKRIKPCTSFLFLRNSRQYLNANTTAKMSSNDFKIYHYEKNSVNFLDNLTLVPDSKHVAFLIPLALFVNIYFRKSFSFAKNSFQLCFCFFVFLVGGNSTKLFDYVSLEMCKYILKTSNIFTSKSKQLKAMKHYAISINKC